MRARWPRCLAVQIRRFRDAMFRHFRHFVGDLVSRFRRRRCRFSTVEDFYYAAASISRHVLNRACAGGTRHSDVIGCGPEAMTDFSLARGCRIRVGLRRRVTGE